MVFPVAALLTMIILGLLLRSLVAPWYLMISVGLGFLATLGATVLIFQHIQGRTRLDLHPAGDHVPVRVLTQMGFAISFGIAAVAFVMALFLTPALTALIGHAAWWPGHADRAVAEIDVPVRQCTTVDVTD